MKQENVDIQVGSAFDAKGFKQAETALSKLSKTVKSAAGALGIAYGARAITQFGIASVKAFAADDKAAKVLGRTLNNLGLGFGNNAEAVNNYISGLEKQTGVLDDELRPAMDRLLRATGDITKSQQLLSLALDISAGTGKSVAQVSQSLQKAYLGQTQALGRLGVGLSKAELTSSSFEEIQNRLTELFAGQAAQAADTYAGKINKLNVAANNAKETIGKGLVDALAKLGGGGTQGLDNTIKTMETFAKVLSGIANTFADVFQAVTNPMAFYKQNTTKPLYMGSSPAVAAEVKKAAAEKAAAKRAKEQAALLAKNTKAVKEQTALQKAGTLFDIEQTQIVAALKGKITDEERKRLELQLAILTGNTSEASKLAGELAKSQGLSQQLAAYLADLPDAKNPFTGWKSYLDMLEAQVRLIASIQPGGGTVMTPNYNGAAIDAITASYGSGATSAGVSKSGDVYISVAGSVVSESDLVDMVNNGLLNRSLSGSPSAIGRLKGSFAG